MIVNLRLFMLLWMLIQKIPLFDLMLYTSLVQLSKWLHLIFRG